MSDHKGIATVRSLILLMPDLRQRGKQQAVTALAHATDMPSSACTAEWQGPFWGSQRERFGASPVSDPPYSTMSGQHGQAGTI